MKSILVVLTLAVATSALAQGADSVGGPESAEYTALLQRLNARLNGAGVSPFIVQTWLPQDAVDRNGRRAPDVVCRSRDTNGVRCLVEHVTPGRLDLLRVLESRADALSAALNVATYTGARVVLTMRNRGWSLVYSTRQSGPVYPHLWNYRLIAHGRVADGANVEALDGRTIDRAIEVIREANFGAGEKSVAWLATGSVLTASSGFQVANVGLRGNETTTSFWVQHCRDYEEKETFGALPPAGQDVFRRASLPVPKTYQDAYKALFVYIRPRTPEATELLVRARAYFEASDINLLNGDYRREGRQIRELSRRLLQRRPFESPFECGRASLSMP